MRKFVYKRARTSYHGYTSDVNRIVMVLANRGIEISDIDAELAWLDHSDSYAAGWLLLPVDDQELVDEIMSHIQEVGRQS